MTIFEATISTFLIDFFQSNLNKLNSLKKANTYLKEICGIKSFFANTENLSNFQKAIDEYVLISQESNRRAYGDFQTNDDLTVAISKHLLNEGISPEFLIEPTCGKGNFIIAALKRFSTLKKIVGIEIYFPYIWETKFKILELFLNKKNICKPEIEIIHSDIFDFNLSKLPINNKNLLIIGNPPWVTNSELGVLNSKNLPQKSNFKKHKGLDAITGKGNFDIAEFITLQLLKTFDKFNGNLAFLVKSSVVKNILFEQKRNVFNMADIQKMNIDAKKEFNVSVDACLFLARLNNTAEYTCEEINFYSKEKKTNFGWHKNKFVYSISNYNKTENIDGKSPFVWRQGMKHDCSKIMEIERFNENFINGFKQETALEKDLLYGLLKSSDLKYETIDFYRKTTIVTQKKVGQDTSYIKEKYPLTYEYLNMNRAYFDRRKSSIYKGKPPFSIFGIGDYSFTKYKIAISGMYKRTTFSLVLPENDKPLMLDDTCYFIGFDNIKFAKIIQKILNSYVVQNFLKAIIFPEAKRPITKDILMRIDIEKAYHIILSDTDLFNKKDRQNFADLIETKEPNSKQMTLF